MAISIPKFPLPWRERARVRGIDLNAPCSRL